MGQGTNIDFRIVYFKSVYVVVVFLNVICDGRIRCVEDDSVLGNVPLSTPTIDVNKSVSVASGRFVALSSFFFSVSLVPGMTRFPFTGAFEMVKVAARMLLSVC